MENIIIQGKENKFEGKNCKTNRTKVYTKVQDNIYDLFEENEVRLTYRMVYMALSGSLIPNSAFSKSTFKELRRKSGVSSDQTISRALDDLSSKGFISKMGNSTYRLWHCVYKGLREQEKNFDEVEKYPVQSTTPSVVRSTTPSVVPHARVFSFKQTKELQHETDDVNFKDLDFGEESPFKDDIPKWQWSAWIRKFKFEWCQTMVTELEYAYSKNYSAIECPIKLMAKGLKDGKIWQLERKRVEEEKKREETWQGQKEQARRNQEVWDEETVKRDQETHRDAEDYALAIRQPYIIARAEESVRKQYPNLDEKSEGFTIYLRFKIIVIYREGLN